MAVATQSAHVQAVLKWDTEKVCNWLHQCDLGGEFGDLFRYHLVSGELLLEMTQEDLKDSGVRRVGPCKRLLKAISELRIGNLHHESATPDQKSQLLQEGNQLAQQLSQLEEQLNASLAQVHQQKTTTEKIFNMHKQVAKQDHLMKMMELECLIAQKELKENEMVLVLRKEKMLQMIREMTEVLEAVNAKIDELRKLVPDWDAEILTTVEVINPIKEEETQL